MKSLKIYKLLVAIAVFAVIAPASFPARAMNAEPSFGWVAPSGGIDNERPNAITVDAAGNTYLTGNFRGTADFDGNAATTNDQHTSNGSDDMFIVSYGPNGDYRWSTTTGGMNSDLSRAITIDNDGNLLVAGSFYGTTDFDGNPNTTSGQHSSNGSADIFIASYDPNGNYRWSTTAGGSGSETAVDVTVDPAGNVTIAGYFWGNADLDSDVATTTGQHSSNGGADILVASYDSNGNYRWSTTAGGVDNDLVGALASDESGNALVTGFFQGTADFGTDPATTAGVHTSNGNTDVFIVSYDPNGSYRWSTATGGADADGTTAIAIDSVGNLIVTGYFFTATDLDGDLSSVGDQGSSAGEQDIFIASYDPTGAYRWSTTAGGSQEDQANDITIDGADNTTISGYFTDTTNFGGDQHISNGGTDIFFASYDSAGAYRWSTSTGGSDTEVVNAITTDSMGNTTAAGFFWGTGDFDGDPTTLADQRTSSGEYDNFVLQLRIVDVDGDGFDGVNGDGADCDDTNPAINPAATDIAYNGVDEDCNGADLNDVDGDGSASTAATGGAPDCDDTNPAINPGATDIAYNGVDEDCNGADLNDVDGDGSASTAATGGAPDCDDTNPAINPAATDIADDGIDQDCDGADADASTATCHGLAVTIDMNTGASGFGTAGDDVIFGTPGADVIDGLGGDDTICGEGGDDNISGSDGLDYILGGDGNDTLSGGDGNDRIRGQKGIDSIDGGAGNDFLYGGIEGDTINGGDGRDTIGGFGGADTINGGPGDDKIFGGFGADSISGGNGDDQILGLVGNDIINGDAGNDTLQGDNGLDTIDGGSGDDVLRGGNSSDILSGGPGNDSVSGGKSDDELSGGDGIDTCAGNTEANADTADATCEAVFGVP